MQSQETFACTTQVVYKGEAMARFAFTVWSVHAHDGFYGRTGARRELLWSDNLRRMGSIQKRNIEIQNAWKTERQNRPLWPILQCHEGHVVVPYLIVKK